MEMPKPGKAHEKMAKFAGVWDGEEAMLPSPWMPEKTPSAGVYRNKMVLDGHTLQMDYRQKIGRKAGHCGLGMLGYDAQQKLYTFNWFSNGGGGSMPSFGSWKGQKLVLEHGDAMGRHRYTYAFSSPDRFRFKGEISHDGVHWNAWMEGTYVRRAEGK